jgi:hypothetical protein
MQLLCRGYFCLLNTGGHFDVLLGLQPAASPPVPAKFSVGALANSRAEFSWLVEYDALRNNTYALVNVWPLPDLLQGGACDNVSHLPRQAPCVASKPALDPCICPMCGKGPFNGKKGLKGHFLKVHGTNKVPDNSSFLLLESSASDCDTSSTKG